MQKTDSQAKSKMKLYADATRNAATSPIKLGDTVLVANDAKGKLTPPFDPRPLIIVDKKGSMLTAADHDKTVTRNSSHFKLLPEQDTSVEGDISRECSCVQVIPYQSEKAPLPFSGPMFR